jgi:hypothetical protein
MSLEPTQFTRESAERIANVVRAAELASPAARPLSFELVDTPQKQRLFRVCTFTGAWSIGDTKTVTFRNQTATPNTVAAVNLFYTLPDNGTSDCAIAKEGTAWYLVQEVHTQVTVITGATLSTAGLVFTRSTLTVVATATASVQTIGTTAC